MIKFLESIPDIIYLAVGIILGMIIGPLVFTSIMIVIDKITYRNIKK